MENAPANVRRHFLPWDRLLLPQAVAWLAADWRGDGPLDLSAWLVIVPTRQAGRRLREALAALAAARGQAVFPPRVQLPESLLGPGPAAPGTASRAEALLGWAEVLLALPLDAFRAVFPVDPPERSPGWALRLAGEFLRLQRMLAESGLRLAEVAGRAGPDFPEAERWEQLAQLEARYAETLAARGRRDPQAAWLDVAGAAELPAGVERVVLLGTPDPLPVALSALAGQARPVDVVVFAPSAEAGAFDGWGRPQAAAWARRVPAWPDSGPHLHLCADPAAQAARAAAVARSYGSPDGVLGLGAADPEVLPLLEVELERAGLAAFNPEGRRRQGDGLHQLLAAVAGLGAEASFAAVGTLARCPDFLDYLRERLGENFSAARFLAELDELQSRHLPPDLAEARRHAPASRALAVVAELRAALEAAPFPAGAPAALAEIFSRRKFDLARPEDARFAEAAAAWNDVLRECAGAAERFASAGLGPAEWGELALRLYGETLRYDDKPAGALELQGWLELLWEDAPHLVVAGFNDGFVPEAVAGDPFLPEALRERLGLKTNAARFARDAYLLEALAHSRAAGGRLDLLFGKTSAEGDPLRPSRLLLRCADAELPERIGRLFRPVEAARAAPPWRRAWRLAPPRAEAPVRVAVTGLRAWLACPFRFYLRQGLRLEPVDPAKNELDALDFGTLCHAALEAMGREPALRDCTDEAVLREFLLAALERAARQRFGRELTLPLVVQVESARQRLARAAAVQAQSRAEGWVIERVEEPFLLKAGGLEISGKIDRIDRHEGTGARRVLDYKTSDRPADPRAAHVRPARRDERPPEFARLESGGRELVWSDLQLPLYLRALAEADGPVTGGYFNLPKAVGETGIRAWADYTPELAAAAWRCAEGVAAAIRAGVFWPPNETVGAERDDFAPLFHHGVAESVAWEPEEAAP